MPGTTRYSATFDRTYEEEDPPPGPPVTRRSRSLSLQMDSRLAGERGPLFAGLSGSHVRSSSTENGPNAAEAIPTRSAANVTVKAHNNPFQFVKVAPPCPLYKKNEDQLKKVQIKKPPVLQEEDEEEWQTNLDSWKTRRRKMSEGAFLRQEELRRLQTEEQTNTDQQQQKKIKKFSEIVEERATRGRALSLCLFSNPLESTDWFTNNNKKDNLDLLSGGSAESSNINSDDDTDTCRKSDNQNNNTVHVNGIRNSTSSSSISKTSDLSEMDISQESLLPKDHQNGGSNGYADSGLESLSSSHRTGDIPDSGSDFSQDSGSSIDCDSPRVSGIITTGVELLEEFSSKEEKSVSSSQEQANSRPVVPSKDKVKTSVTSSPKKVKPSENKKVSSIKDKFEKNNPQKNGFTPKSSSSTKSGHGRESENEMFVDDFEELARMKSSKSSIVNGNLRQESLNIVYQSNPQKNGSMVNGAKTEDVPKKDFLLISQIPVDKVTEEMERLILEQLEEEERAKEMNPDSIVSSPEVKGVHELPVRKAEPPKEKPPPPPEDSPQKDPSIKRVNSTKRILKEINKRRTDFLGIENSADQSALCELSLPPPPALEDLLRAEREQDLQRTKSSVLPVPSSHEDEIVRKEREIIENLETEERNKTKQDFVPDFTNARIEEERLQQLKVERKKMEEELMKAEAEKSRMEEALQLQKREELVRKQEADAGNSNVVANAETLAATGDGKTNLDSVASSPSCDSTVVNSSNAKKCPPPPPPKPVKKKKEALRKERERLRQEQEDLQREREEHRRKIQLEQEQLQKQQAQNSSKLHVPDTPTNCRVGPPTLAKPTPSTPQELTPSSTASSVSSTSSSSRSLASSARDSSGVKKPVTTAVSDSVPQSKATSNQTRVPAPRAKDNNAEPRSQPKANLSRRPENIEQPRYNQNHWLIQEAEMRRITEHKERQRAQHHPAMVAKRPPIAQSANPGYPVCAPDQLYGHQYNHSVPPTKMCMPPPPPPHMDASGYLAIYSKHFEPNVVPSTKTARTAAMEKPEQILSVSGRKRCSHCGEELGRGAAMIIESLQLYYHIHCFRCCVCQTQLGNGSCGTDVRVRNNKLHCHNCYSNDEAGLKFSQV